ncbi:hypothetical protein IYY11_04605 [Methylocystis sp. H62]|jgi:hypothetical protein|uniref:JAB domain-containing protein n=1 Tax=Methylocystis rosea TaxID=173366 RepID=A0ABX6ENY8_9HYPH|nr:MULTISPECIES: hypothetical protein [Alphaproteobacteria]MBA3904570.1 hypothetical protein [Rhodocyclaceae bacterium]MBA4333353.1 hypothetical protein [Brevundimonas sp.]MBG0792694.1 hypothetical protein [Methylocystis sp. H62]MBG0797239.1 hypothetical protein [Methylocystis sp. L43]MBG0804734.1 hypothetical protein [Methylocystis sp. H15]
MTVHLKIDGRLLDAVRQDLHRPHAFAYERVGFFTAGAADLGDRLLLTVRDYMPVADEDYEVNRKVGAKIGSAAMRKAVQSAYRPAAALLHVHTHGGHGKPGFSGVDLNSAKDFVPGFFETTPRMPHGLLVLSNDAAHGLLWLANHRPPVTIDQFQRIDAPMQREWGAHDLA